MRSYWVIAVLVGLIPAAAALTAAIILPTEFTPPLGVEITSATFENGTIAVTLQLTSHRASYLSLTVAEVTGRELPRESRPIYFVEDPSVPVFFGSLADVQAQLQRVASQLAIYGDSTPVQAVTLQQLPNLLATHPNATLVDLESGILPADMLAPNSTALADWLDGGGTLIWSGGPLGFYQSVADGKGNQVIRGTWAAQGELLGFPLVDPTGNNTSLAPVGEPGPLTGSTVAPVGDGLQTAYWGVPYGANTTVLAEHLGVDIGWDSVGEYPRTSLAVLPIGRGTLDYFGGALGPSGGPAISDAGYGLAIDVARLIGSEFVPTAPVPPAVAHVNLAPFASTSITFYRASTGPPAALIVQVTVGRDPSFFGLWPLSATSFGTVSERPWAPGAFGGGAASRTE